MQVILNKSVEALGRAGDVVKVKDGYARNYLLPREIALLASKENLALVAKIQKKQEIIEEKERVEMSSLAEKIQKVPVELAVLIGEEGKMFGSITATDIAKVLKEAGFDVEKKRIHIKEPIKTVGDHEVDIRLSVDVTTQIKVKVSEKPSEKVLPTEHNQV